MRDLVLDCSALLSCIFPDEGGPYGTALKESLRQSTAHVPAVWWFEVTNAMLVAERRGRFAPPMSLELMGIVESLRIVSDTEQPHDWIYRTMTLGRTHGISAYDASYLELASRRGLPIATLDDRLGQAAERIGVPLYNP